MSSLFNKVISTAAAQVKSTAANVQSSVASATQSAVDNVPKPSGKVTHVTVKGIALSGITLGVTVAVHNPYLVPIPITSINYDMQTVAGGRAMAKGIINSPGVLKASGDTDLPVVVTIPYTALWDIAKDAAADWDIDYNLHLGFIFDLPLVPAAAVPFTYRSSVKLPTIQDLLKGKGPTTAEQRKTDAEKASKDLDEKKKALAEAANDALKSLTGGITGGGSSSSAVAPTK